MRLTLFAVLASSAALAQQPPAAQPAPAAPAPAAPAAAAPAPAAAAPAAAQGWTQKFDDLWARRDAPGAEKSLHQLLKAQLATDPGDFEANWRLASLLNWQANATQGDLKASLGKGAQEAGDKAILARPDDVRGHYHSGVGVGLYSEGVGILTALSQGLEGKFRDRLQAALRIDKDYLDGQPQVVWGRYFFKLPWPKRDVDESVKVLTAAVASHPNNWRAKIYLADSLADQGKGDEARKLVQAVVDAKAGDDAPEEKRLKDYAAKWLSNH